MNKSNVKNLTEFLSQSFPTQREFCGKWVRSGELVMIYAPRGTGKSLFCSSVAHTIATGQPFLGFKTLESKVLIVDGETSDRLNAKRYGQIDDSAAISAAPDKLQIWSRDPGGYLPNLSTESGQKELTPAMMWADVTIIDNLLTVAPLVDIKDNDIHNWYRIKPFIYKLRNLDKCIILIHHAGKSGTQIGTSLKENDMDIIIRLTNPPFHENLKQLAMYFDFDKARDLFGNDKEGLYLTYETIDGKIQWTYQKSKERLREEVLRLHSFVKSKWQIAKMLHCDVLKVHEILTELKPNSEIDTAEYYGGFDEEPPF